MRDFLKYVEILGLERFEPAEMVVLDGWTKKNVEGQRKIIVFPSDVNLLGKLVYDQVNHALWYLQL